MDHKTMTEEEFEALLWQAVRQGQEQRLRRAVADGYDEWAAHRTKVRYNVCRWALAAGLFLFMVPTAYVATAAPDGQYMSQCDDRVAALRTADQITQNIA